MKFFNFIINSLLIQTVLVFFFLSNAVADQSCNELIRPLTKSNDSIAINGGLWGLFEKKSFLRKYSTEAIQLDSRINKIFFILNYLCETKNGLPLNDLATYISRNVIDKGESEFKTELLAQGKTPQQINIWFEFFEYAKNQSSRTLDLNIIHTTINYSISLINDYVLLEKNTNQPNSSDVILKKVHTLMAKIDNFLSKDPYATQALDEISRVPFWDINESTGGS